MAQVNSPNAPQKDDALTTLMKGLTIASQIYGIRSNMAQLDEYKQKQEHQKNLAEGKYNKDEQLQLAERYNISKAAPTGNEVAYQATDVASGSPIYLSLKAKESSPLYETIQTTMGGKKGTAIIDKRMLANDPKKALVAFYEGYEKPVDKTPVRIDTVDAQGNPVINFVEPKAGASYAAAPKQNVKLNKEQFDAALYGRRIEAANSVLDQLAQEGYNRASYMEGLKNFVPEGLQSGSLKRQNQAERNFVNAVLRRESGAAIPASEFENAERQYFPRAGDTPEVLAQKEQNRLQALEGMRAASGDAWEQVPLVGLAQTKKDTSGQAFAAPAQNGPSPLDLIKIKAANGDKKAQEYLQSLGGKGK